MFVTYVHTRSEHIAHIFIRKFSITSTGIRKNYCNGSVKFMTGKRVDRFGPPCQTQSEKSAHERTLQKAESLNTLHVCMQESQQAPKYLNVPTA